MLYSLEERSASKIANTPHGDGWYFRVFLFLFSLGQGKLSFAGREWLEA
jgi:hypothetical protein